MAEVSRSLMQNVALWKLVQAVVLTDDGSSAALNIGAMIHSRERREFMECRDQKKVGVRSHLEQTNLILP